MGVFCVCIICHSTVDFNRIKDSSEHLICDKCIDKVPEYVPESQHHVWLQRNKRNNNK
jgi:recombinational DNA repair protein (RecF pathway)